jgi:hypothetical protein
MFFEIWYVVSFSPRTGQAGGSPWVRFFLVISSQSGVIRPFFIQRHPSKAVLIQFAFKMILMNISACTHN